MRTFREFTFCNADQVEITVQINCKTGNIIDMYCYADHTPDFENPETGRPLKTAITECRKNKLFATITNRLTTLRRMVERGDYLPLIDNTDPDFDADLSTLTKCLNKYQIKTPIGFFD